MRIIYILLLIATPFLFAEDTGDDGDFAGADLALPKQQVKSLDNVDFVENYGDFSEFQEGVDAEEIDTEGFYRLGRMFSVAIDLGVGAFTGGYAAMNTPAARYGVRATYFYGVSLAVELSFHYQSHPTSIYAEDGISGWFGQTTLTSAGVGAKYYLDTRNWSDVVEWFHPHATMGIESITLVSEAIYEPGELPGTNAYSMNMNVWALQVGVGLELQLFAMTYLGINGKYHYGSYHDEGIYQRGYDFQGDTASLDFSLIFYF